MKMCKSFSNLHCIIVCLYFRLYFTTGASAPPESLHFEVQVNVYIQLFYKHKTQKMKRIWNSKTNSPFPQAFLTLSVLILSQSLKIKGKIQGS